MILAKHEIDSLIKLVRTVVQNAPTDKDKHYWGIVFNKLKMMSLEMEFDEDDDYGL